MSGMFPLGVVAYHDQRMTLMNAILDAAVENHRETRAQLGPTDAVIARCCWALQQVSASPGDVADILAAALDRLAQLPVEAVAP